MTSLEMGGSAPADAREAQAARLEGLGRWLMAGYWLALLAVLVIGGMAAGS